MTENDSTTLTEPLLPLHSGEESLNEHPDDQDSPSTASSYEQFPHPPELTEIAETNVQRSFGIVFSDLATKSIWNQNLLSIYVALWNSGYVGIVQAAMGLSQTLSCELAKYCTRRSNTIQPYSLVHTTIILGISAMLVSTVAMIIIHWDFVSWQKAFVWFAVANSLWGVFGGLLETTIPIVFVKSMSMLSCEKLQSVQGLHDKLTLGSPFGTLFTIGLFFLLGNEWTNNNLFLVLGSGLFGYLCIVVALCFLKPIEVDDVNSDDEDEWADARDGEEPSNNSDEQWFDPLPAEDDEATNTFSEDPLLRIESTESEAINADDRDSTCCDDAKLVPMLIHASDAISSLAGGISAWYLPLFLVQFSDIQPISFQFLYLVLPLGQKASASIANQLAKCSGPCLACMIFQWIYILLLLGMTVCVNRGYDDWRLYALYFLHGSLMNSTSSLSLGMIANHVPFEEQHKWELSAVLQKIVWSSSGLLGGWLASSRYLMFANLYTTAAVQFLAGVPLLILYCTRNPTMEVDPHSTDSDLTDDDDDDGEQTTTQEKRKQNTLIPSTPETESGVSEDGNWLV